MSAENELNSELSEVEALLKQFSPTASKVDRDALLYQAGWAAAAAQSPRKAHWLWPTTTAALAASLLMLLTFPPASPLQRSRTEPPSIANQPAEQPTNQSTELAPQPTVSKIADQKNAREPVRIRRRYLPTAPLLVMRDRALRLDFDDFPVDVATGEISAPAETTNRQLLKEFLPTSPTPESSRLRFWSSWNLGETT